MKNFLLIMAVCVVGFVSCKKDDNNSNSDTSLLIKSSWKLNTLGFDANKDGTVDYPQSFPDCQLDDSFTFKSDGSGTYDNGVTKCTTTDPQTASFSWSLQGKTMNTSIPGLFTGNVTIHSLDATSLVLWKDTAVALLPAPAPPTNLTVIVTLKH